MRRRFPPINPADWPSRDRTLWARAQVSGALFEEGGLAAAWRPDTIKACERNYGVFLGWLKREHSLDESALPRDRVSRELIEAFVTDFGVGRSQLTVAAVVRDIAYVLRACHPPEGVGWLTKLGHRLVNTGQPARPKLPRMARPFEIMEAAETLMSRGRTLLAAGKRSGAPIFRDGMALAFLIRRPIRLGNLAGLRIGVTLIERPGGFEYDFPPEETKTSCALAGRWPDDLREVLEYYLKLARPVLMKSAADDSGWLWIGRRGRRMTRVDLSQCIGKQTARLLGRRVSPHLFRDCAATEIALSDPTHVGITKSVLGHATLSSSQKYYNQAQSFSAFARHGDAVRKARREWKSQ